MKLGAISASDKIGGADLMFKITCENLAISKVIVHEKIEKRINIPNSVGVRFRNIEKKFVSIVQFLTTYPFTVFTLLKILRGVNRLYVNDFLALNYAVFLKIFKSNCIIYCHLHSAFRNTFFNRIIISRFINKVAFVVIVPSHYLAAELDKLGVTGSVVIHNGIDPLKLRKKKVEENIGLRAKCRIGIFGALNDQKGQDVFVKALDILLKKEFFVEGNIAGYLMDKVFAEQLETSNVVKNGKVILHGEKSHEETLKLMNEQDIVVCASKYREVLPTVLLEAMALGKPIVGTSIGGIPEIIINDQNGIIVSPNDEYQLAGAIEKIITENLFGQFGEKNAVLFGEMFSLETYGKKMNSILNQEPQKK